MSRGNIFNIQHFSVHDGPGIRTTVFLKGCNLRCWWCHNPEAWSEQPTMQFFANKCIGCHACDTICPQATEERRALFTDKCRKCGACAENCYAEAIVRVGEKRSAEDVLQELLQDKMIYQSTGGGITFSGGEPLLQIDFLTELLPLLRQNEIHTAVETALCVPMEEVRRVLPWFDLILCDIKCINSDKHRQATGRGNEQILENIRALCKSGKTPLLRTPIIPGFNDNAEEMSAIAAFVASLPGKPRLELLPFHGVCVGKYQAMQMEYPAAGLKTPSERQMETLAATIRNYGVSVTCK